MEPCMYEPPFTGYLKVTINLSVAGMTSLNVVPSFEIAGIMCFNNVSKSVEIVEVVSFCRNLNKKIHFQF